MTPAPLQQFDEFASLAIDLAERDVAAHGDVRHHLVGYRGQQPLVVVDLRPFPPGGVGPAVVEAVAGMLPLGVDRLAGAMPGRAWSLDDPIPPVSGEVDLRQRVLVLIAAHGGSARSWLQPFDLEQGLLHWHDAIEQDGSGSGWVHEALAVASTAGWPRDAAAAREQLARCTMLGHDVELAPGAAALLG